HFADIITGWFDVPRAFLAEAVEVIRGRSGTTAAIPFPLDGWPATRDALAGAIEASATPARADRLFPGDIEQFAIGGGSNVAHGAAGVLYALAVTGAQSRAEYADWLAERALRPASGTGVGFYTGLHGVAYVLERL